MRLRASRGVEIPSSEDPVGLADWLEAAMLIQGLAQVSRSWLRSQLRSVLFPEDRRGYRDLDSNLEVALDDLWAELNRRRRAARGQYPYERAGGSVTLDTKVPGLPYVFLLCVSVSRSLRTNRRHQEV